MIRRVSEVEMDGSTVTLTIGRHEIRALKASYADGLEPEMLKEMGTQAQTAMTPGTYKTDDITISFRTSVFRSKLMPLFPQHGGGNKRVSIVVGFFHPDIGSDSDLLKGARCVNWAAAMENSSKALEVETKWKCLQIFWTSRRITVNALTGVRQVGADSF